MRDYKVMINIKGGVKLKKHLLRSIGVFSLLIAGVVSCGAKFWFFFEPKE
jgi:hypothetical protein